MNKISRLLLSAIFMVNIGAAVADTDVDVDVDSVDVVAETEDVADSVAVDSAGAVSSGVVQRMDCKTMKSRIDTLKENGENSAELDKLQQQYRKDCVILSVSSRASNARVAMRRANMMTKSTSNPKSNATAAMATASVSASKPAATDNKVTEPATGTVTDEQKAMCDSLFNKMSTFDADTKMVMKETYDSYCAVSVPAPNNIIKMTRLLLGEKLSAGDSGTPTVAVTVQETEEDINAKIVANLEAGLCGDGSKPNKYGCCPGEKFTDIGDLQFACCPAEGNTCYPPIK